MSIPLNDVGFLLIETIVSKFGVIIVDLECKASRRDVELPFPAVDRLDEARRTLEWRSATEGDR